MADTQDRPRSAASRALAIPLILSLIFKAIEDDGDEMVETIEHTIRRTKYEPFARQKKDSYLAACAVVNSMWYGEAIRVLYGRLRLPLYPEREGESESDYSIRKSRKADPYHNILHRIARGAIRVLYGRLHLPLYPEGGGESESDYSIRKSRKADPYHNILHRIAQERRQFIAGHVHTLVLSVEPHRCSEPLKYAEMLSHLEFPRLKRLELDTRKFEPGPLPTNPLTRRGSDLEAYKVLFSSPNLVELDFGNGCALALPLYLEALDPLVLQGLPDRLTTLSIYVNRQDNPANLRVLSRCKRLKCLELLSVSDILQKSSLATIIPAMSCILFSLEVLHIDQSAQEWKYYSFRTISEKEGLPEPPHVHLKELHLRGTTNWVGVFLKNNDSSGMESLRLQLLVRGSQTVNLDHLCGRNFSKLKRLEISLYFESESSDHGGYPTTWITPDRHFSPEKLLSILNTMPVLNHLTLGSHEGWDRSLHRLELEMDDHFLSKLGDILPRLEHLSIKNDLKSGKWTSTGFIALGRRCRYLTYFNVGGRLDITDPMFEEELRQTDIRSVSGGRDQSGPAANFSPLFPFLRTLAITSLPPRTALSDEYPPETYPRAPPETLTRIVHLITAHFPRLSSISRFETDPLLQMELRRKRTTLDWPMNRLSHFASPWYARFATQQVKWKFETRRREGVTGDAHDSDSNSEVDLECARGVRDGCYKDLGVFGSKEVK